MLEVVHVETMKAACCTQEVQVGRSIVKKAGEDAGPPVERAGSHDAQVTGIKFKPIEHRDHCCKNTGKENGYLFYRYEVEIILKVDFVPGREITGHGSANHNNLADGPVQEDSSKNNKQKDHIVQALNPGVLTLFLNLVLQRQRDLPVMVPVDNIEDRKNKDVDKGPDMPGTGDHPEKRDAFQVPEEKRRVADRGE